MATTFLAYDLLTNDLIDELPFTTFSYADVINKQGGFEGTLPLEHPRATAGNLAPWRTAIYVDRDGVLLFGGILTDVSASLDGAGGTLRVGGIGFFGFYKEDRVTISGDGGMTYEVLTDDALTFTAVDQFRIVQDLVEHGNSKTGQDFGLSVTWPALSGVTRTQTYLTTDRKCVGEAIEALAKVDDGFDFAVTVAWSGNAPAKELRLYYPRKGRELDIVFEAGKNIKLLSYSLSGAKQANYVDALGSGDGRAMKRQTSSDINDYYPSAVFPRLDAVSTFRDVSNDSTLLAHAEKERLTRRLPIETMRVAIQNSAEATAGAYTVGDDVYVRAEAGYLQISDRYRIEELRVSYDENGNELIEASLASMAASLGE